MTIIAIVVVVFIVLVAAVEMLIENRLGETTEHKRAEALNQCKVALEIFANEQQRAIKLIPVDVPPAGEKAKGQLKDLVHMRLTCQDGSLELIRTQTANIVTMTRELEEAQAIVTSYQ
ncbi:MAG: hypothetical protein Q4P05_01380 [Actinomycetaceae bacterium]|nr:hypothetical protein [Actinomycetaceae bacterium]